MDVHYTPGVKAREVAQAHELDLINQVDHGCKCMTYWIDENRESIFCLIEGPNKEAVEELHRKAHGMLPTKVIEVSNDLVESFLGRIYDPENARITEDGLKVFEDPSFRILLATRVTDPVLLEQKLGREEANKFLSSHNAIIRKTIKDYGGREAEHAGIGFIISFSSATKAAECAMSILKAIPQSEATATGLKMGINSGEPVEKSNRFFGDTIRYALNLCSLVNNLQVALSSSVKELIEREFYQKNRNRFFTFNPPDEDFLKNLFENLEKHWHESEFDVDDYCKEMAMSRSQLYRKTISLTGFSPNILLKEFRLESAKEMMKKQNQSISQITFNSGFTSPSYFTKCFRKKYDVLPMTYIDLLHRSVSS